MWYWFWPILWLILLYCTVFWAIHKLRPTDPYKTRYQVTVDPGRAALRRKKAANAEEHKYWTYRFSELQIQAHKARVEAQQDAQTKEN
jgi:hypothetical protein